LRKGWFLLGKKLYDEIAKHYQVVNEFINKVVAEALKKKEEQKEKRR
jgi:uncharacterized protein YaaR (DUF327 family)